VITAGNKLKAFNCLAEARVPVPRFAASVEDVTWDGPTVVRHLLRGHSGEGIELIEQGGDLPRAPLYVEYIKKQDEYRIHVVKGEIIAVQRKARDRDNPNPNWQIRNHQNGFIFVREGVRAPESARTAAVRAVEACGLDFGAVDIVFNERQNASFVLEINTAPGLEGQTIDDYATVFKG
jgi:glutathione synthase/RimK-type ligase-like ATP-grasp enzyme